MNEELNQINNDIRDLESRLSVLKDRKQRIQSKLSAPDLVGKYIYYINDILTYYMKVDKIDFSNIAQNYIVSGSSICVINQRVGTSYELKSHDLFSLTKKYEIIDKERYDYILKMAFDKF